MNRTIIYARVSTEDQVERYGLPVQLRACRERAQRDGLNVIVEITDDGISGAILERSGLDRVRSMVRNREVDVVLMLDVDRLSRELAHLLILKPEIERFARLEFVASKFEDSPSGRLFFGMRGVIAQYERELTRERTMRGRKERARAGLIAGGRTALGYTYADGRLTENPATAPTVRRIFEAYLNGSSLRSIAITLRSEGVPTWSGRGWAKSSVRRILANETYAGTAHYGTHRREGKLLRLREGADRISLPAPALVSREQWEAVQARLAENPLRGRPSSRFLLRGILRCSNCGRRMCGESGRKGRSYRCVGRDPFRSGGPCRNHIGIDALDGAVWRTIVRVFSEPAFLRQALERHEADLRSHHVDVDELRRRAAKLRRKEEAALSAMLDPDLAADRAAIKAEYRAAAEQRRGIERRIAELQPRAQDAPREWAEEISREISEMIRTETDPGFRQQIARRVLDRAEWNGEEITMRFSLVAKSATTSECCDRLPPRPEGLVWPWSGRERRESQKRSLML